MLEIAVNGAMGRSRLASHNYFFVQIAEGGVQHAPHLSATLLIHPRNVKASISSETASFVSRPCMLHLAARAQSLACCRAAAAFVSHSRFSRGVVRTGLPALGGARTAERSWNTA